MKPQDLLDRIARGAVANVSFEDFCSLVEACGFELDRTRGSHHIYRHSRIPGRLSLQPRGGQAKPYQIRQFLRLVETYRLRPED